MTGRKKRIVKVGLCLIRGAHVLLARSHGDRVFQIPGGKPEAGEDDLTALIRETAEELEVSLIPGTDRNVGTFVAPAAGRSGVEVEVRLYSAEVTGAPRAASEIAELLWHEIATDAPFASDVVRLHILPHLRDEGSTGP
ncbi:NUDIX domain-containing protein [Ponticoccus sp. SC2-23]|uniref:NUDIX hydrolase n=1 Tax=Alexandriicola marinus TaxID=2081710 RepID=UPI000FDA912D|nr:NUDIX domain-containing protein [Alexandriicola marinus]MBM1221607.1 NUDIX domain-containing protein [Ponticoccus sp. SC6-9]MBM1226648.1 NUDIX domain-containing protein [Ponticoccus sp. SC6-15]MBM1230599.1 NUDIX domain-containing protein [Ponticoccus sp. SC6-38]MBM1235122.1 NUDIX domain-containing protein [Ponticoccus sp. SC6-45]MBM1239620.1 NUDIX domain-containing protein [Ponticoccus sp. SC6-49]MBM1243402.1 NUDIX domain-containing protein [Ponticoccus sp. SC2-64]MBM1248646.1 NUDIX domai